MASDQNLISLPMEARHRALGARLAPFSHYSMPTQYPTGILAEHAHVRTKAGFFDISHMGQALLEGADAPQALEALTPGDILGLKPMNARYTQFLNDEGGILDDLIVTRISDERLFLVVNAARKSEDFALLRAKVPQARLHVLESQCLFALQGPMAAERLEQLFSAVSNMAFMTAAEREWQGKSIMIFRSGYTGEDGFEISVPETAAGTLMDALLALPDVAPIGLGARDTLRLEAGLCLYGHDIDEASSPIEAGLAWSIGKRRRQDGSFPGAERILRELAEKPARRRIGLKLDGRAPAREGAQIVTPEGEPVGVVTSGGFSPTLNMPIAMGYARASFCEIGTRLDVIVRGKPLSAVVAVLPFAPHRYHRA